MQPDSNMTHRERFYAVLAGERPDHVPVFPNLDFWRRARRLNGDWPPGTAGMTEDDMLLSLGMGLIKGAAVYQMRWRPPASYDKCDDGRGVIEEWTLPGGSLRRVRRRDEHQRKLGMQARIEQYPIRTPEDLELFIELMNFIEFDADPGYARFRAVDRALGENGVAVVGLSKSPAHDMMMKWTGYENAYIHMAENPVLFDEAIHAAGRAYRRAWDIVADSPCRIVQHGGNYSAMTPPPIFRRWLLPYLKEFNRRMHSAGKWVLAHTDGDMTGLLELFLDAEFDGTNCHACEPLVACTLDDCAKAWDDKVVIWGGMPCIMLENGCSEEVFEAHLEKLLNMARSGMRLVVGVSDHVMPGAIYPRIARMGEFFSEERRVR